MNGVWSAKENLVSVKKKGYGNGQGQDGCGHPKEKGPEKMLMWSSQIDYYIIKLYWNHNG